MEIVNGCRRPSATIENFVPTHIMEISMVAEDLPQPSDGYRRPSTTIKIWKQMRKPKQNTSVFLHTNFCLLIFFGALNCKNTWVRFVFVSILFHQVVVILYWIRHTFWLGQFIPPLPLPLLRRKWKLLMDNLDLGLDPPPPSSPEILSSHGEFGVQRHIVPKTWGASFKMPYLRYSVLVKMRGYTWNKSQDSVRVWTKCSLTYYSSRAV